MHRISRREFVHAMGAIGAAAAASGPASAMGERRDRPNVVLILTDDQGYGDLGCHGNDRIRTPNLDRLSAQSTEFTRFYSSPVCAPTRASLMTGRYNYRTGAIDTYLGRAMMHPDEVTLAQMLHAGGYRTGIFGKWHLGDNYPMRPYDRGFEEALVHKGGGMCQPAEPPGGSYFDPLLDHNGVWERHQGYCTDVFTNAAIEWISAHQAEPFFCYLATNAPHTPVQVDDRYVQPYRELGFDEENAGVLGMITNLDENVGCVLDHLDRSGLAEDTIVIFMTDNGPQQARYVCGLRGLKGSVYEGGIRVPSIWRWPGQFEAGRRLGALAAHIDVVPTLIELCGVAPTQGVRLDGTSLVPWLSGEPTEWPDRTLFFQWHRGDEPELYRACAAVTQRDKLVDGRELYDLEADPGETRNLAADRPGRVAELRAAYERWFADVSSTRGYAPPRIVLGTRFENPSTLTRQDWRGPRAGWGPDDLGYWEVEVAEAGEYDITLRFAASTENVAATLRLGAVRRTEAIPPGAGQLTFRQVALHAGPGRLEAWVARTGGEVGVEYVDVRR